MAAFGNRKAATPSPAPPSPLVEPSAADRLSALLAERSDIEADLTQHRLERDALLRADEPVERIEELDAADRRSRLRLEQLELQLPPLQAAIEQERIAAREAEWQARRPALADAQAELAQAIDSLFAALDRAHGAHAAATRAGFADRLGEFVRPPPAAPVSDYALREFVKAAERRYQPSQPATASLTAIELDVSQLARPARFTPRRVPLEEIEAISPIAPTRRVQVLHGPVRTAHFGIGIARMHEGETHIVSARAAHALVASGCAEYVDESATAAA